MERRQWLKGASALVVGTVAMALRGEARDQEALQGSMEISFRLPEAGGNPFDYTENDVRVEIAPAEGKPVLVPAFFDGNGTWRIRYSPRSRTTYHLRAVTRNGQVVTPTEVTQRGLVAAKVGPTGFIGRDPKDIARLMYDGGATYYPVGHNVAWKGEMIPDIPDIFVRMKEVGENWSRVWMNHWDGKNLDWKGSTENKPGVLHLDVAQRWDEIVRAAEQNGIHFQMVLQHHGQYSSRVNPNWGENPWNKAKGGFLEKPEEFFTSTEARRWTRAKYRYIVARWGYSPAILAWELFNEVQFTDACANKQYDAVAAWHKEMAEFLRLHDVHGHLICTSSDLDLPIYTAMDYLQPHAYEADAAVTVQRARPAAHGKPIFFGEIGPSGDLHKDDGSYLHAILWASLVSDSSGAAQYWTWDHIHRANLYGHFKSLTDFLKATNLVAQVGWKTSTPTLKTKDTGGSLNFAPGGGWATTKQTTYTIQDSGTISGVESMPSYLQGDAHREMFPHAEFLVELKADATFGVEITQVSKAGAKIVVTIDDTPFQPIVLQGPEREGGPESHSRIDFPIPKGKHRIRLENQGADWVRLGALTLSPFGPSLRVLGKATEDRVVLWVRNVRSTSSATGKSIGVVPLTTNTTQPVPRPEPSSGEITLPILSPGSYRFLWWDTVAGKEQSSGTVTVEKDALTIKTPLIEQDMALYVEPVRKGEK